MTVDGRHSAPSPITRREVLKAGGLALGALAVPRTAAAQAPKKGGTLVYGMEGPSDILDPQATGCWLTYRVTFQMFEGLVPEALTRADAAQVRSQNVIADLAERGSTG